jgi:hypothetical protein
MNEELEFTWNDGFWVQETGDEIVDPTEAEAWAMCLNKQGKQFGFGLKNNSGVVVYSMSFCKLKMYYDEWEYENGDGFYPFDEFNINFPTNIDIYFVLNNDGIWVQHNGPDILGLDGDGKEKTLAALNKSGFEGRGIQSKYGRILC